MRTKLVECKNRKTAKKKAYWAAVIAKCEGGYMCFESVADYEIWKKQK